MQLFTLAFSFFLLMDPIGNVPLFATLLKNVSPKRQRIVVFRELIIALGIIILFVFFGEGLLAFLHISQSTIQIAGGIILFLIALKMIFPPPTAEFTVKPREEPFLVPMAIPLVAGPSILAAVMIYAPQMPLGTVIAAVVLSWLASALILTFSTDLRRLFGDRGMSACERLMGLILILISTEMLLEGLSTFLKIT